MGIDKVQEELTNRIIEMIEGENIETLREIINILNYHNGYQAGIFKGSETFNKILVTNVDNIS